MLGLTDNLIAGLRAKHIEIVTPVAQVSERSAIVCFTLGSEAANKACHDKLRENKVIVALRGSSIRVSPNFFNTEAEIERFLALL